MPGKFAALMQKGFHQDATIMTAEKVMEMATIDGARAVDLEAQIGSVEIGKKADLIVIDYENPFMTPIHNPVSAIVYSALGHEVSTVIIDGRFVMRDGVVTSVNGGEAAGSDQRGRFDATRGLRPIQAASVALDDDLAQ